MLKLQSLSVWLALFCTKWQLWLLLRYSLRQRKVYLYRSAGLFWRIGCLSQRKKLLEQKLILLNRGGSL